MVLLIPFWRLLMHAPDRKRNPARSASGAGPSLGTGTPGEAWPSPFLTRAGGRGGVSGGRSRARVKNSPGSSAEGAYRQREGSRCKQDDQVGPPQNAPVRPFAVQKHHMPDPSSAASSAGVARGSVRVARATAVPLPARRRHWLLAEPAGRRLCCTSTYDPSFFAAASRWAPRTGRPMPIPRAMIAVSGMMKSPMMLVPPCSDERPTAWIVHYWGLRRKGDRSANLPWPNPAGQMGQSETNADWAFCHCLPCI